MTKEELKQEAENKLDEWTDPNMGCCEGYCYSEVADFMFRFSEPREKRIEELENKLTKAKELIKRLINACCSYGATGRTTAEAEQFLKETDNG